jgi:capsular polysaccharide biosynthesis protein
MTTIDQAPTGPFQRQRFGALPPSRAKGVQARAAQTVALPELPVGRHMLERMTAADGPDGRQWQSRSYLSVAPHIFELRDVLVHSSAGIICFDTTVVEDTLDHTAPFINDYEVVPDGIKLFVRNSIPRLTGTYLSLLAGNHGNYFHWMMECLARLSIADDALDSCAGVLVPEPSTAFHGGSLLLTGLPQADRVRFVAGDETLRVDRLIVPWSVFGHSAPHPCIAGFFRDLRAASLHGKAAYPRRIYIDRRGTSARRLVNEDEVVQALDRLGFVPVVLEHLSVDDQVGLFANADIVVGPHGAGLCNIVYARPGCRLVELHMDTYPHWAFRNLAAISGVDYDCVVGRQLAEQPGSVGHGIHAQTWVASVTHTVAAVEQALARR